MEKILLTEIIKDTYYKFTTHTRVREAVRLILLDFCDDLYDPYIYFLKIDSNDHKFGPRNHYELPGGGIELGESEEIAAKREAFEEIGAKVSNFKYLGSIEIEYNVLERIDMQNYYVGIVEKVEKSHLEDYEKKVISGIVKVKLSEVQKTLDTTNITGVGKMIHERDLCAIHKLLEKSLKITKINDEISYINEITTPILSSEVIITKKNTDLYVYDCGNNENIIKYLNSLSQTYNIYIILSHFHKDHMTNLKDINYKKCYVSKSNYKYVSNLENIEVIDYKTINDLKIITVKSNHTKDSLVLVYKNEILFGGDLIYPKYKDTLNGEEVYYNKSIVVNTINSIKDIDFKYIYSSHKMKRTKKEVIIKFFEEILKQKSDSNNNVILKE